MTDPTPTTLPEVLFYLQRRFEAAGKAFETNLSGGGVAINTPDPGLRTGNATQSEATESPRRRPAEISTCESVADNFSASASTEATPEQATQEDAETLSEDKL